MFLTGAVPMKLEGCDAAVHRALRARPNTRATPCLLPPQSYGPGRRAHSVALWLASSARNGGAALPEDYFLLLDPDILIMTPPPVLASPTRPATFYWPVVPLKPLAYWWKKFNTKNEVTADAMFPTGAPGPAWGGMPVEWVPF